MILSVHIRRASQTVLKHEKKHPAPAGLRTGGRSLFRSSWQAVGTDTIF